MSVINVLSREIAELIAAGEVIERPASVIKELVENSIDSGAKYITVEIKHGGISYMRVTDDGCGMSPEDVPLAFLRHATSKIAEKPDLDNIHTLGFRGEALASVAAVSKVEVMSKQRGDEYGTIYSMSGGEEEYNEKSGCPDGTTVIVRDLFYNVPARAKFLKKDVTEANAISNIMQKMALSNPGISFKFIRDNRIEFNSAGDGELYSAVYAIYGKDFARDLIPVDYTYNNITVKGLTVKPLYSRNNRSFQNFFVNDRYIRSKLCSASLENAYSNMIMVGKFPACVISLYISPSDMDVNIHPSKAEVRFTDEKSVSDAIYFAVKNALMNDGLIYEFEMPPGAATAKPEEKKPETEPEQEQEREEFVQQRIIIDTRADEEEQAATEEITEEAKEETKSEEVRQYVAQEIPVYSPVRFPVYEEKTTRKAAPVIWQGEDEKPEIKILGEVFGLYIIAEYDNKMIMIDKHAAHERIIFERLKSGNCRQFSQSLLMAVKILFTSEEIDVIENNTELLENLGFSFDFSERPCIKVTAVPTFLLENDIEAVVFEVAENLKNYKRNPQSEILEDMFHRMACRSAVKANDRTSEAEMKSLAEQVIFSENIRHCPHGRPVMFTLTKANIDHRFGRT